MRIMVSAILLVQVLSCWPMARERGGTAPVVPVFPPLAVYRLPEVGLAAHHVSAQTFPPPKAAIRAVKEYYFSARETRCIGDYDILLYKTVVDARDATARLLAQPSTGFHHMAINPPVTEQEDVVTDNSVTIGLFAYRNIQFYIYAVTIIGGENPAICRRRVVATASTLVQHTDAYAARGAIAPHSVAHPPKGLVR
jgi:hypothetical protein